MDASDAVTALGILDRIGDPALTAFTRLTQAITGASAAAVHVFDESHQRRIAAVGVPLTDSPEEDSMCRLASVPLQVTGGKSSGVIIGTLCAFDSEPRELSDEQTARLEDIAQLIRSHLELVNIAENPGRAATRDALTGAVHRVILDDRLAMALARHRRHGTPTLVAVIDLDDFAALNDAYGQDRGDAALRFVARNLLGSVREEDTVGRLGGDEFAVVAEASGGKFGRLHELFRHAADGFEPHLDLSVGAVIARDEDDVESILRRAHQAMRAAKQERKRARQTE